MGFVGTHEEGFDASRIFPPCLSKFGILMIWVGHWITFAVYSYSIRGTVSLRDVFGGDFVSVFVALAIPAFTAPIWVPVVYLLAAMFRVQC